MSDPRVFASVPLMLVAFAESLGLERARVLEIAGLSEEALGNPDDLVPYECVVLLWRELITRFPTFPLGLRYAMTWSVESLGVVGYSIRQGVHQALALTLRFSRLVDPFLRVEVEHDGQHHRVRLDHESRALAMVEPMEMLVAGLVRIACGLVRDEIGPTEVCFRHAARHPYELYEETRTPRCLPGAIATETHFGRTRSMAKLSSPGDRII